MNVAIKLNADKTLVEMISKLLGMLEPTTKSTVDPRASSLSGIIDTDKGPIIIQQGKVVEQKPEAPKKPENPSPKEDETLSPWGTDEEETKPTTPKKPSIDDEPEEPAGASPFDELEEAPKKPDGPTHDDVLKALQDTKTRKVDVKAVRAVLAEYKAKAPADIDPKSYAEFIGKINALKGAN